MADFLEAVIDGIVAVIKAIFEVLKFICNLIINFIAVMLIVVVLPCVWRIPSYGALWADLNGGDQERLREFALINLGFSLFDIITFIPFAFSLCSWRCFFLCSIMSETNSQGGARNDVYNTELRIVCWYTAAQLLVDIMCFMLFMIEHICFWRIPLTYQEIFIQLKTHGCDLVPCCCRPTSSTTFELQSSTTISKSEIRMLIAADFFYALADFFTGIFCIAPALFTLVSWRSVHMVHQYGYTAHTSSHSDRWKFNIEGRLYILQIFFMTLPADIFTALAFVVSHIFVWRIHHVYSDCSETLSKYGTGLWPASLVADERDHYNTSRYPAMSSQRSEALRIRQRVSSGGNKIDDNAKRIAEDNIPSDPPNTTTCMTYIDVDGAPGNDVRAAVVVEGFLRGWLELFINVFTLPPFLLVLFSWRCLAMCKRIGYAHSLEDAEQRFSYGARFVVWREAGMLFCVDFPILVMFILSHVLAPWRLPLLYGFLREHYAKNGSALLPSSLERNERATAATTGVAETDYHEAILTHFMASALQGAAVVITIPQLALACLPWRVPFLIRGLCGVWQHENGSGGACGEENGDELKTARGTGTAPAAPRNPFVAPPSDNNNTSTFTNPTLPIRESSVDTNVFQSDIKVDNVQNINNDTNNAPDLHADTSGAATMVPTYSRVGGGSGGSADPSTTPGGNNNNSNSNNNIIGGASVGATASSYSGDNQNNKNKKQQQPTTPTELRDLSPGELRWEKFFVIWTTALYALSDIFMCFFFVVAHLSLVRIPILYSKLCEKLRRDGCELCPWTLNTYAQQLALFERAMQSIQQHNNDMINNNSNTNGDEQRVVAVKPKDTRSGSERRCHARLIVDLRNEPELKNQRPWDPSHTDYRAFIFGQCGHSLIEILLLPFIVLIAITVYRGPRVVSYLRNTEDSPVEQKLTILAESFRVFLDLFTLVPAMVVLASGLRTATYINDIIDISNEMEEASAKDESAREAFDFSLHWMQLTWTHFAFLFRDVLLLPFALLVFGTLYRFYFLFAETRRRVMRWAPITNPAITNISEIRFEAPPNNRKTGVVLKIKGSKQSDFVVPEEDAGHVAIFVRSRKPFWDAIADAHGGVAATMGQNMLPYVVKPQHFDATKQIRKGETDVDLVFDFDVSPKTTSISKQLNRIRQHAQCTMQIEYGSSHQGTLLVANFSLADLVAGLDSNQPVRFERDFDFESFAKDEWRGERFVDVWWKVALIQSMWILIDIITVIALLLLHCFPHRIIPFYARVCESKDRRANRKFASVVEEAAAYVESFPGAVDTVLNEVSAQLKLRGSFIDSMVDSTIKNFSTNHAFKINSNSAASTTSSPFASSYASAGGDDGPYETRDIRQRLADRGDGDTVAESVGKVLDKHAAFATALADSLFEKLRKKFPQEEERRLRQIEEGKKRQQQREEQQREAAARRRNYNLQKNSAGVSSASSNQHCHNNNNNNNNDDDGDGDDTEQQYKQKLEEELKQQQRLERQKAATAAVELEPEHCVQVVQMAELLKKLSLSELATIKDDMISNVGKCCDISKGEGVDGLRKDLKNMWWELLLDVIPVVCFIAVTCTVYRAPWLWLRVMRQRNASSARWLCVWAVWEVVVDVGYLILFCMSLISIRQMFALPYDLVRFMWYYPSFTLARVLILHHWALVGRDLRQLIFTICSCRAFKTLMATAFFGFLSPGVMVEGALVQGDATNGDSSSGDHNVCKTGLVLLFAVFWMFGLPPILGTVSSKSNAATPGYIFIGFMLGFYVLGIVASFIHRSPVVVQLRRPVIRTARPNWHNIFHFFFVLLEVCQLFAICYGTAARAGVFPQSETVAEAARSVFLIFRRDAYNETIYNTTSDGPTSYNTTIFHAAQTPAGIPVALAITVSYFLFLTMPVVAGNIMHWNSGKRLRSRTFWSSIIKLLGFAFQITVAKNLGEALACDPVPHGEMISAPGLQCWSSNEHWYLTLPLMMFCVFYFLCTLSHNVIFDEAQAARSDIVIAELYRNLTNGPICAAVFLSAMLQNVSYTAILVLMIVASVWGLFWSLFYGRIINTDEGAFCTLRLIELLRIALYFSSMVAAILCLVAINRGLDDAGGLGHVVDANQEWAIYASMAVMASSFVVGLIVAFWCRPPQSAVEDTIDEARDDILNLEELLVAEGKMTAAWLEMRTAWRRRVETALRVSTVAAAAVHLETGMYAMHLNHAYLRSRPAWIKDAQKMVDEVDKDGDFDSHERLAARRIYMGGGSSGGYSSSGCRCDARCCCHPCILFCCYACEAYSYESSTRSEPPGPADHNVSMLTRVVQTLKNAVGPDDQQEQQEQQQQQQQQQSQNYQNYDDGKNSGDAAAAAAAVAAVLRRNNNNNIDNNNNTNSSNLLSAEDSIVAFMRNAGVTSFGSAPPAATAFDDTALPPPPPPPLPPPTSSSSSSSSRRRTTTITADDITSLPDLRPLHPVGDRPDIGAPEHRWKNHLRNIIMRNDPGTLFPDAEQLVKSLWIAAAGEERAGFPTAYAMLEAQFGPDACLSDRDIQAIKTGSSDGVGLEKEFSL